MTDIVKASTDNRANERELTPIQQVSKSLESEQMTKALEAALSGTGRSADRFRRQALLAIQNAWDPKKGKNPLLEDCTRASLYSALQSIAATGLDLDPSLGHAAIVPRGGVATVSIMYRGLIALAQRSTKIDAIDFGFIHSNDKVKLTAGTEPRLDIEVDVFGDRGAVVGYYCVTYYAGGRQVPVVMSRKQVEAHRAKHKTGMVWGADFESMALKTVVRKAAKAWPIEVPQEGSDTVETVEVPRPTIDTSELQELRDLAAQAGADEKDLCERFGVESFEALSKADTTRARSMLRQRVAAAASQTVEGEAA